MLAALLSMLVLHAVSLTRQQVGVEDLTIEFPQTPYKGFGTEQGYNALYFWSTAHCWVKNVAIINADMGVALDGTYFCTVSADCIGSMIAF